MITERLNKNEYAVFIYDWVGDNDDYECGQIKRQPLADDESDLRYWMFYPNGKTIPMSTGDLKRLAIFMSDLNKELKS